DQRQRRIARAGLLACAVAIGAAAIWFICIQLFVIGAICKYFMSIHGLGIILALFIIASHFYKPESGKVYGLTFKHTSRKTAIAMIALGLVGAGVLAAGEALSQAPQARVVRYGDIAVNVQRYPIIGSRNARHILILFADYTCPFCRQLHHYVEAAL